MSAEDRGTEKGGAGGGSAGKDSCTPRLLSVVVTWCDEDCRRWRQEVKIEECHGMIWTTGPVGKAPPGGKHPGLERLPKQGTKHPLGRCNDDEDGVPITMGVRPPPSYCWFDGSNWVCPDGL